MLKFTSRFHGPPSPALSRRPTMARQQLLNKQPGFRRISGRRYIAPHLALHFVNYLTLNKPEIIRNLKFHTTTATPSIYHRVRREAASSWKAGISRARYAPLSRGFINYKWTNGFISNIGHRPGWFYCLNAYNSGIRQRWWRNLCPMLRAGKEHTVIRPGRTHQSRGWRGCSPVIWWWRGRSPVIWWWRNHCPISVVQNPTHRRRVKSRKRTHSL